MATPHKKTLIGVLASHDAQDKNEALKKTFEYAASSDLLRQRLKQFGFVFTGGTYRRLFKGHPVANQTEADVEHELEEATKDFLHDECGVIKLPEASEGGVTILSSLLTLRYLSILWLMFSPVTTHLLFPQNLALIRLADLWRAKKFMNSGSIKEWLDFEANRDVKRNPQLLSLRVTLEGTGGIIQAKKKPMGPYAVELPAVKQKSLLGAKTQNSLNARLRNSVIALISHDEMKGRMLDFVVDHENELLQFKKILTTGTTGKLVADAAPCLDAKIHRYHSGPKGGDIEIATEILFNGCNVVIFFVDPLNPHPHSEDIKVVFGACMIQDQVRVLSNEFQARDWMDRLIRGT